MSEGTDVETKIELDREVFAEAVDRSYRQGQMDAMRWIPVGERLPDQGQRTLLRCHGQTFVGTFRSVPFESGEGIHAFWDGDECDTYLSVTHWMPLPEPPAV